MKRRRFTLQEKMSYVRSIKKRMEDNGSISLREACKEAKIHHKQYLTWNRDFQVMKDTKNSKAASLCVGRSSILKPVEDELVHFIAKLREQGRGQLISAVILKATSLSSEFRTKSKQAQYHVVRRFIKSRNIAHQTVARESQKDSKKAETKASDQMESGKI